VDARTRSSNRHAHATILAGVLAVAGVPAGVAAQWFLTQLTLIQGIAGGAVASILFGLAAIAFWRRAQLRIQRSLGRSGGAGEARIGRALGVAGLCFGVTAALALAFYGLLVLFSG
jgi:hypothetical protein